jgi:4'-phosphopantetheinyl transferase
MENTGGTTELVERFESRVNSDTEYLFPKAAGKAASPNFRLEALDIHLWSVRLDDFLFHSHELVRVLSFEELVEAQKRASEEARKSYIACRGLLRYILSCYVDAQPKEIQVELSEEHHSVVQGVDRTIRFDLSYTSGEALYAVAADRPLGVSLAAMSPMDEAKIVSYEGRFPLIDSEREAILGLSEEARTVAFFRILTRKQALARAQWGSMAMSTAAGKGSQNILPPMGANPAEHGRWSAGGWSVEDVMAVEGYVSAVAARSDEWRLRSICVKPD